MKTKFILIIITLLIQNTDSNLSAYERQESIHKKQAKKVCPNPCCGKSCSLLSEYV